MCGQTEQREDTWRNEWNHRHERVNVNKPVGKTEEYGMWCWHQLRRRRCRCSIYHSSPVYSRPRRLRRLQPVDADTSPTTCLVQCQCQPPRVTTSQTVNSRQPSLCGCGSTHLEYTANWRRCGKLTVHLPPTTKTFLIQAVISWHQLLISSS